MKPTKKELEKLKKVLNEFEAKTRVETGVKNINGGFATADMFDYDDDYYDVELKWGVQDGVEDTVHTEQYKVNRETWEIENA